MPSEPPVPSGSTPRGTLYHRLESPSQSRETSLLQEASGEISGSYNRDMMGGRSPFPSVDAYVGPLPAGVRGIEFTTDVPPDRNTPPWLARWTGPRDGVIIEGAFAKLRVEVIRNTQRGDE